VNIFMYRRGIHIENIKKTLIHNEIKIELMFNAKRDHNTTLGYNINYIKEIDYTHSQSPSKVYTLISTPNIDRVLLPSTNRWPTQLLERRYD
jgi:hypothetical protein